MSGLHLTGVAHFGRADIRRLAGAQISVGGINTVAGLIMNRGALANASQLSGNAICSSCRACEAAFGCEAVVNSVIAVRQAGCVSWTHDCFAAERSLAGPAAATKGVAVVLEKAFA